MQDEIATDLQKIGPPVHQLLVDFYKRTGRKLKLEIEPGNYLIANAGCILTSIDDMVQTGSKGYKFIKLDCGMDMNNRPSLYGARHALISVSRLKEDENKTVEVEDYIVVGHCCETGDLFTQQKGGELETRKLRKSQIKDVIVMEGCGAYCSSMSTKNYNSYPEAAEVLVRTDSSLLLIRKRQTLEQMMQNEIEYSKL